MTPSPIARELRQSLEPGFPGGPTGPGGPGGPSGPAGPGEPMPERAQPRRSTAVLEREQVQEQLVEPGDHERFSHYVRKEKILESALTGEPVVALCGKVWVPGRDPQRFPVCPMCKEIYAMGSPGDDSPSGSQD